jgi:hypothetical protein
MCSVQEPKEQAQKQHSKIGNEMRQHWNNVLKRLHSW